MNEKPNNTEPILTPDPNKTSMLRKGAALAVAGLLTAGALKAEKTVADGVHSSPLHDESGQVVADANTPRDQDTLGREIKDTTTPPVTNAAPVTVEPSAPAPASNREASPRTSANYRVRRQHQNHGVEGTHSELNTVEPAPPVLVQASGPHTSVGGPAGAETAVPGPNGGETDTYGNGVVITPPIKGTK